MRYLDSDFVFGFLSGGLVTAIAFTLVLVT